MQAPVRESLHPEDRLVSRFGQAFGAGIRAALREAIQPGPLREALAGYAESGLTPDADSIGVGWLPIAACEASGGDGGQALPIAAAWQLVRLAVKLLDDVEDGVPGATRASAMTVNAAAALYSAAHVTLASSRRTGLHPSQTRRITDLFHSALLSAASGQHLDLETREACGVRSPDEWLEIASAKSGSLLRWATMAGAIAAGARRPAVAALGDFGLCLGVLLQLADDLTDCWQSGAEGDLNTGRLTLPACYAFWVASDDEAAQLRGLLQAHRQGDASAAGELGRMLTGLGAEAYLVAAALSQRALALAALDRASSASGESMQPLLEPLIGCVFPMFRGLGV